MTTITAEAYLAALHRVGIAPGDVVLFHSRLFALGVPECGGGRDAQLEFYLRGLQQAVGTDGTIVAMTSFEDYGRYNTPFVLEQSPSRGGALSEYVRTRSGAVRSLHPLLSLTALGRRARELCSGTNSNAFGYGSAWDRLVGADARMLFLGVTMGEAMTFAHYVEYRHGVPYTYTKLYDGEVWAAGQRVERPFTASVRYLDFDIAYDLRRLEAALFSAGVATQTSLGDGPVQLVRCRDVLDIGSRCLDEDLYYFLKRAPRFRPGVVPTDGAAGPAAETRTDVPV